MAKSMSHYFFIFWHAATVVINIPFAREAMPFVAFSLFLCSLCNGFLYPEPPDTRFCSQFLGRPLNYGACQTAVDNLPRGGLPSIFTIRAHTVTNNYIQVPVRYSDIESRPSCIVTIDLDGHSRTDQFVAVPWDEIKKMAQILVDLCVGLSQCGGFMTYGVGRTFESLIHPTAYEGTNVDIPTPAWVQQPDGTVESVAIPSSPTNNGYSKFSATKLHSISWLEILPLFSQLFIHMLTLSQMCPTI